jgi:mRNA interferase RelE/StbE
VKIRRTESFLKDYRKLSPEIRQRVDKQLTLLLGNPRHPSLRLKKIKGTDKLEMRVTKGYRITMRLDRDVLELRRVGTHDLLKMAT